MEPASVVPVLLETELFAGLDREPLESLVDRAVKRVYKKGEVIFRQGDSGDSLFVLVDGSVKVVVGSERGDEMVLVTLQAPATFGELALVDGRPRSASVEAIEPTRVLILSRAALLELNQDYPSLLEGLLRVLGSLLRRLTDQASDFVFLDLHGRVAKLLVGFAEARGDQSEPSTVLDLNLTQADLARMVGGSRQSVNQILSSLEARGYLEVHRRQIVLKRLDLLRRRAGL